MEQRAKIWQILVLSGVFAATAYILHAILGGLLWAEYDAVQQTISELTEAGAPHLELLLTFLLIYGILGLIFSVSFWRLLYKKFNPWVDVGATLMMALFFLSFFGYLLFPLDDTTTRLNFQNSMHIFVTGNIVLSSIFSLLLLGIGLWRYPSQKKLALFLVVVSGVIVITGGFIGYSIGNQFKILGVIDRINIFSFEFAIIVLSIYFNRLKTPILKELNE